MMRLARWSKLAVTEQLTQQVREVEVKIVGVQNASVCWVLARLGLMTVLRRRFQDVEMAGLPEQYRSAIAHNCGTAG